MVIRHSIKELLAKSMVDKPEVSILGKGVLRALGKLKPQTKPNHF